MRTEDVATAGGWAGEGDAPAGAAEKGGGECLSAALVTNGPATSLGEGRLSVLGPRTQQTQSTPLAIPTPFRTAEEWQTQGISPGPCLALRSQRPGRSPLVCIYQLP